MGGRWMPAPSVVAFVSFLVVSLLLANFLSAPFAVLVGGVVGVVAGRFVVPAVRHRYFDDQG